MGVLEPGRGAGGGRDRRGEQDERRYMDPGGDRHVRGEQRYENGSRREPLGIEDGRRADRDVDRHKEKKHKDAHEKKHKHKSKHKHASKDRDRD